MDKGMKRSMHLSLKNPNLLKMQNQIQNGSKISLSPSSIVTQLTRVTHR